MPRFVQALQLLIAIVIGIFLIRDTILHGIGIYGETWVVISIAMALLLELALFVIYKLIEDD